MKHLLNFMQAKSDSKNTLFSYLKCSKEEVKILRYMCEELLKGNDEILCIDIINTLFNPKEYEILNYLPSFKNLLELGWITQNNFLKNTGEEIILLELINTSLSLSTNFLKVLEGNEANVKLPENIAYENHLEYLKDQFLLIQNLWGLIPLKNDKKPSPLLHKIFRKTELFQQRIEQRIKITKIKLPIESIFKENALNKEEKILFLALLKEEYSNKETEMRDLNSLINLISMNNYERMKNRNLLDDGGKLIQKGLIDYDEIFNPFGGISRTFFIPDAILKKINPTQDHTKKQKVNLESLIKSQDIFVYIKPKVGLDKVVLNQETKETLGVLLKQVNLEVLKRLKSWGIKEKSRGIDAKIILYGPAGTGKTLTALALAKSLKKPVLSFDCSKILSMYVGESEKNVRNIFETYQNICTQSNLSPVLLLNEADQFLSTRTTSSGNGAEKMHNQMQNIFLEQIENFNGILIATTNLLETIDSAFSRRFNYKIEFKKPDLNQRILLWEKLLPKNAPFEKDFNLKKLADFPLTGGQISVVVKNTAYYIASLKKPLFTTQSFITQIQKEINSSFDQQKEMGFL